MHHEGGVHARFGRDPTDRGPVVAELGELVSRRVGDRLTGSARARPAPGSLSALGVGPPQTEWQDDGNFVRLQVVDPDGYRVELFAY